MICLAGAGSLSLLIRSRTKSRSNEFGSSWRLLERSASSILRANSLTTTGALALRQRAVHPSGDALPSRLVARARRGSSRRRRAARQAAWLQPPDGRVHRRWTDLRRDVPALRRVRARLEVDPSVNRATTDRGYAGGCAPWSPPCPAAFRLLAVFWGMQFTLLLTPGDEAGRERRRACRCRVVRSDAFYSIARGVPHRPTPACSLGWPIPWGGSGRRDPEEPRHASRKRGCHPGGHHRPTRKARAAHTELEHERRFHPVLASATVHPA